MRYFCRLIISDDETLFAAFTCLRERPHVVVCFKSAKQERLFGVTAGEREAETEAAMDVLGCTWEQWPLPDDESRSNGWTLDDIAARIEVLAPDYDRVFAPAVEEDGLPQHNLIGRIADVACYGKVTHYMTYTNGRDRSQGIPVPYDRDWVGLKLCALSKYESQIRLESTGHHFMQPLHEWYEPGP